MTVKYLSGAYPSGYSLNANYTGVLLFSSASVGATGLLAGAGQSVTNFGAIDATTASSNGVSLLDGGTVMNGSFADQVGQITGDGYGVYASTVSTVVNYSTITGATGGGIDLHGGGNVSNGSVGATAASIQCDDGGVLAAGKATVANYGTIHTIYGSGVRLSDGGSVTNGSAADATALILSDKFLGYGVYGGTAATVTVTNFATIAATNGISVDLGNANDRLIAEAGSTFVGAVKAAGGYLELAGGTGVITGLGGAGTVTGAVAMNFSGFSYYVFDQGSAWTHTGDDTLGAKQAVIVHGSLTNLGSIQSGTDGLDTTAGASVINGSTVATSVLLQGANLGIEALGASSIANYGAIQGGIAGVAFFVGGAVVNGSLADNEAQVHGVKYGILAEGATTVTNFGTITGAISVDFLTAYSGRLIAEAGSTFVGAVKAAGGTLELAGGTGTISGLGTTGTLTGAVAMHFSGFRYYDLDKGSSWTHTGMDTLAANQAVNVYGSLANLGTISSSGDGVDSWLGASVRNGSSVDTSALLQGASQGVFELAAGTLANFGTITSSKIGVALQAGGKVANGSSTDNAALIDGVHSGLVASGLATVTNFGTIHATHNYGAWLAGGGMLTNGSTTDTKASIQTDGAKTGVIVGAAIGTVTNFGTIASTGGLAVQFYDNLDRLIAEAGSTFVGAVVGGKGTLELAGGTGTISGLGAAGVVSGDVSMNFSDFGYYVLDKGSDFTHVGDDTLTGATPVRVAGSLTNLGSIHGANYGVYATSGGGLTNGSSTDATALLSGKYTGVLGDSEVTITNFGTIKGGADSVVFLNTNDRLIDEAGSTLTGVAVGGGGALELAKGTGKIRGLGTTFNGFATYQVDSGGTWTMSGTNALAKADTLTVANSAVLTLLGALGNAGTVKLTSTGALTDLRVAAAGATLSGGGTVTLSGSKARIRGASASAVLTNQNNTIMGQGSIGAGSLTLVNEASGVIDATGALALNTKGKTLVNAGLLEATTGGTLSVASTTVANSGTILAAGGRVNLQGSDIVGGTLTSTGAGLLRVISGASTIDGSASQVKLSGALQVTSGATLVAQGALSNAGKISLTGGTLVVGPSGLTLSGGGQVNLSASTANVIVGATSAATLTNVDNRISGAGHLGNGAMALVNQAGGVITDTSAQALTINTGGNTIQNAGTIAGGVGGVIVASAIDNTGRFLAARGTLTLNGAVTGAGRAVIDGGTLKIGANPFAEGVTFSGATGVLRLADSQAFTGKVSGLSKTGTDWLQLVDIAYKSGVTKASYSGTTAGGTLTVTDGLHTAKISLVGDYTTATWKLSAATGGGTKVADPTAGTPTPSHIAAVLPFVQTMARWGALHAGVSSGFEVGQHAGPVLAMPRASSL